MEIVPMKMSLDLFSKVYDSIPGLKKSTDALKACGMQPELAAHLMLQCQALNQCIILRAGSPPVYNQKRAPKDGLNLSKTSNQGLIKGSIAVSPRFSRVTNGIGRGTHRKDTEHLNLKITDPDYQHTVALPVTMQDILRELSPEGDLQFLGYENGKLRLAYKESAYEKGKVDPDFQGQFVIDLKDGDPSPIFYSRPWDHPSNNPLWDHEKQRLNKPDELAHIPDEDYFPATACLFKVYYTEHQHELNSLTTFPNESKDNLEDEVELEEVKVFANTPKTALGLIKAIRESGVLESSAPTLMELKLALEQMDSNTPLWEILHLFTPSQLKIVYDHCGLVVTGDWDGLALGHPSLEDIPLELQKQMRVYNTFHKTGYIRVQEKEDLLLAACNYFHYLKANPEIFVTPLGSLLQHISDPLELFSEESLARAGCITPFEYLFQQMINYTTRDVKNQHYGESVSDLDLLQFCFDKGLEAYNQMQPAPDVDPQQRWHDCLQVVIQEIDNSPLHHKTYRKQVLLEHIKNHLKIAIQQQAKTYVIPHPDYEHNVHNLFQHGFDMRNPYGSNLDGAWLMILGDGMVLHGENERQLTQVLVKGQLLERNYIEVSPHALMSEGWGNVIQEQLKLKQPVHVDVLRKFNYWLEHGHDEPSESLLESTPLVVDGQNEIPSAAAACTPEQKSPLSQHAFIKEKFAKLKMNTNPENSDEEAIKLPQPNRR